MNQRDAIIEQTKKVPALPIAAVKVVKMLQDPDVDINQLLKLIEVDPALTTTILRIANSAFYSGGRSIHSLRNAVMRLGTKFILHCVVISSISPVVKPSIQGYDLMPGQLLEHLVGVGLCSKKIVDVLRLDNPDSLYTASLLHDVGKIVLGTFIEADVQRIMDLAFKEQLSFEQAEREILGIDHAEVGAILLESWNIPPAIVDAARWHHSPEECQGETTVVNIVHASNVLCIMSGIGMGADGLNYHVARDIIEQMGLTEEICDQVIAGTLLELNTLRGVSVI